MTKFLEDLREIDTLQIQYRAMEAVAQRASNTASAMAKRKYRVISSQDDDIKQQDRHIIKRRKKRLRKRHNNARNVKRTNLYSELTKHTNNAYLQGTVTDGIQEYLTRLSNYKDE